jgi:hypothetical protein
MYISATATLCGTDSMDIQKTTEGTVEAMEYGISLPVCHRPVLMPCVVRQVHILLVLHVFDDHRTRRPAWVDIRQICMKI